MAESADKIYERLLVLRSQVGDELAFGELVARYNLRLRYFLRKMLGQDQQAEDALQDVWLDVFKALAQLKDVGAFPTWLYRIARDRAYRLLRRRRVPIESIDPRELEVIEAEEEFTPEDARVIHAALDQLSPERREALILRFIEDMSYEKMAEVAGVPVGTIRSRLHLAKRDLRRILETKDSHEQERPGPISAGL